MFKDWSWSLAPGSLCPSSSGTQRTGDQGRREPGTHMGPRRRRVGWSARWHRKVGCLPWRTACTERSDQREGLDFGKKNQKRISGLRKGGSRWTELKAETRRVWCGQWSWRGCRATSSDGGQVCKADSVAPPRAGAQEKGRPTPPGVAQQHGQSSLQQDRDGTW